MMKPIMKICQVLGVGFIIAGLVGLATLRGSFGSDALLIVTGGLLLFAFNRLELAQKRIEQRTAGK